MSLSIIHSIRSRSLLVTLPLGRVRFRIASGILAPLIIVPDFLHSDPETLASYIIFSAGALAFGFFAVRQELYRRKLSVNPSLVLAAACLAGAMGAALFGPVGFGYDGAFLIG